MSTQAAIRAAPRVDCRPWPRFLLSAETWAALVPDDVALEALWADTNSVYALFIDAAGQPLLASVATRDGRYAALSRHFPGAAAPERMVRDLWGHEAEGAADIRPWLDHGVWGLARPLAPRPAPPATATEPVFRPIPEGLMQLPIGPVIGRLEEPVHLRVGTDGVVARTMEARLGYAHKGTLLLVRGKSPRAAARFAARLSADATVAHATAFACATEAALGVAAPPRAVMLRGVMLEVERIATHLGDLAAACPGVVGLGWHREQMLRASAAAFGHRMMMDCVVPGGLAADIEPAGPAALGACLAALLAALPDLAAGVAGRPAPAVVAARLERRMGEIDTAIALLQAWLLDVPPGATGLTLPSGSGEGIATADSPRGPVWHWLRLDGGTIGSAFFADPSWRLWPEQEAASLGADLADLARIAAAFGCARSGVDL